MSPLDRKLLRDVRQSSVVLVAITSICLLGVSVFVAMTTSYRNLEVSRVNFYANCRMPDFWINVRKLPDSVAEELSLASGISELRTRITGNVRIYLDHDSRPISGIATSLPDRRQPVLSDVIVQSGTWFQDPRQPEVLVGKSFAEEHQIHPGEILDIILDNREQRCRVVGTAIGPEFIYQTPPGGIVPDPENYAVLFFSRTFAEGAFDIDGAANQLLGRLTPSARQAPGHTLKLLKERLDPYGHIGTTKLSDQGSHVFLTSEIENLRSSAIIIPSIFLGVSAVVLNLLMRRLIQQQRTVIGTLKALGYRNSELAIHFAKFGLLIGVMGGLLGCGLGYLLAEGMTIVYRQYFELPDLFNRLYPDTLAIGLLLSVVFSASGTWSGIREAMSLKPAEAMRPAAAPTMHKTWIERLLVFWKHLDFRWQMALRGMARHSLRSATVIGAASIGTAMVFVTIGSYESIGMMLEFQFEKVLRADWELSLTDERDTAALLEARRLPTVDHAEGLFFLPCTLRNGHREKTAAITGVDPGATLTVPCDLEGNAVAVPEYGLLLTRPLAERLDITPGELLSIEPSIGERRIFQMPVMAISESYLGLAAYAQRETLSQMLDEHDLINSLRISSRKDRASREEFTRAVRDLSAVETINDVTASKRRLENLVLENIYASVGVTILFAGMLFFGSVLNFSMISLSERKREVATFRVIGYRPGEVADIFLIETVLLNSVGAVLGLPVGYGLFALIIRANDTDMFRMPVHAGILTWTMPLVAAAIFTMLAHFPVRRQVAQMRPVDELNVKE
ncbi:ABC transporter permease [Calycomorphotria hydatis]|uniref:Macrolide transporter ATP-binding /permease protein n=1 Tax=Calycomorphotria hydatis TaxID=2528027 RepID=A0A517T9N1_9PLAN|nr:FtsX-like permease family protein [Calycomorphotria hydatis]QDT65084.1 macrolide transporter ATP-binding /permease protein [Calycomorphotria hydatis]